MSEILLINYPDPEMQTMRYIGPIRSNGSRRYKVDIFISHERHQIFISMETNSHTDF